MADLSTYSKNLLLSGLLRAAATTLPSATYMALYTTAPTDAGGGTEVSGGSYARVQINSLISAPTNGVTSNGSAITFPTPTGSWGTVEAFGILDASTGGNLLMWDTLASPEVVNSGNLVEFPIGDLDIVFA